MEFVGGIGSLSPVIAFYQMTISRFFMATTSGYRESISRPSSIISWIHMETTFRHYHFSRLFSLPRPPGGGLRANPARLGA